MFTRSAQDDVRKAAKRIAAQAPTNVHVHFDRTLAATALWDYGEDRLSELVLSMSDKDFRVVQRVATTFADPSYPLPMSGQRISNAHVIAFAAVTCVDGLRPPARTRRRPGKARPKHLPRSD